LRLATAIVVVATALAPAGCGRGAKQAEVDYTKVRAMGDFYSSYIAEHRGQPPKDEQAFRGYLATKEEQLNKAGLTVDEMFTSPRGSGPIVWVYGKKPPQSSSGTSYFGYEKSTVDGKRLVIGSRGSYEHLDDTQFRKAFPNAS
jgi:hypothetical protein